MREVINDTLLAFALKVAGSAAAFVFNVAVARLLGADGAGLYFLALAITTVSSVIGRVGLDSALLRFVAVGAARQDWPAVKGVYTLGIRFAVIVSGSLSLAIYFSAQWVASVLFSKPELAEPLRWMSFSILPFTLINLQAESLKGIRRIRDALFVQGIGVPVVALCLLFPLTAAFGPIGAAKAYLAATVVVALLGIWAWNRSISDFHTGKASPFPFTGLWGVCKTLFVISVVNRGLLPWMPLFALGLWSSAEDVGIFGAASRISMLVSFLLVAVNNVLGRKFAELYAKNDIQALGATARRSAMLVTLLTSPIYAGLFMWAGGVMSLYGEDFVNGANVMVVLAGGQLVNTVTGSVGMLLVMSGNEKKFNIINLWTLSFQAILLLLLVPAYGAFGAAIATALAVSIVNLAAAYVVFRSLGIVVVPFLGVKD